MLEDVVTELSGPHKPLQTTDRLRSNETTRERSNNDPKHQPLQEHSKTENNPVLRMRNYIHA